MTKTHLKSPRNDKTLLKSPWNDQNSPEIAQKWPKLTLNHPGMTKTCLKSPWHDLNMAFYLWSCLGPWPSMALGMAIRTHCKNDHCTPEITQKWPKLTLHHPGMTKTHLKSPRNDQTSPEITQNWPKLTLNHTGMTNIHLKSPRNDQKKFMKTKKIAKFLFANLYDAHKSRWSHKYVQKHPKIVK